MRRARSLVTSLAAAALVGALLPLPALHNTAELRAWIEVDMELAPRSAEFGVLDTFRSVTPQPPDPLRPGVVFTHDGSASSVDILRTAFVRAETTATATWDGVFEEGAVGRGRTLASGGFEIVTEIEEDQELQLITSIRGCYFEGSVDDDVAEAALAQVGVWLVGSPELGLPGPDDPIFYAWQGTREVPGNQFDLHCVPFQDRRTITLPGFTDPFVFDVLDVGVIVAAGGTAGSFLSGSASEPLLSIPGEEALRDVTGTPLGVAEQTDGLLSAFDAAVEGGTLVGSGPGRSAGGRLWALRSMLRSAAASIESEDVDAACGLLLDALSRLDGRAPPPDFAQGPAAETLAFRIQDLRVSLGCDDA